MHAADDANLQTIQDGKALNDLNDEDEEDSSEDEFDSDEQVDPYKRRKTQLLLKLEIEEQGQQGISAKPVRSYGNDAKKQKRLACS